MEAGRPHARPGLRPPPPAAPGLADVVRRPRDLRGEPLVRALPGQAARRLAARPGPAGEEPLPRPPPALCPRGALRLPLHPPGPALERARLVDPRADGSLLPRAVAGRRVSPRPEGAHRRRDRFLGLAHGFRALVLLAGPEEPP